MAEVEEEEELPLTRLIERGGFCRRGLFLMQVDRKAQVRNAREEQQMSNELSSAEVLRTPAEWCHIERVEILDADGWRGRDGRDFTDPVSLAEFQERLVVCTQRSVATCKCPTVLCSCHHQQPAR